jgi:hypothetical protein
LESAAESQCVEEIGIVGNCELLRDEGSMRLVNSLFHALSRLSHSLAARTLTTVESRGALRLSNAARVWRPSTCEGWAPQLSARAECSNICVRPRVALWLSKLSNMNCWEGDMNWLAQGRVTL